MEKTIYIYYSDLSIAKQAEVIDEMEEMIIKEIGKEKLEKEAEENGVEFYDIVSEKVNDKLNEFKFLFIN